MEVKTMVQLGVALLALISIASGQKEEALIDTGTGPDGLGKIQGSYAYTSVSWGQAGPRYYWFTGIPYAKPDSYRGRNRFKPAELWDGDLPDDMGTDTFWANETKAIIHCPQNTLIDIGTRDAEETNVSPLDPFSLIRSYYSKDKVSRRKARAETQATMGQEDCLIVTVSTPQLPKNGVNPKLPVIYFIHGGGFDAFWGSVFGGQRLLNHPVVLVTINYRLGVLGSLNLGIEDAPGNAAVYDCIRGLEWVQKYIHHFGGDKDRVTVSGQSAGAVLATTVFLSPLANGLIHRAIGDSGSAYSVWANQKDPIREHLKVVQQTKCNTHIPPGGQLPTDEQAQVIRDCMQGLTLNELVKARDDYGDAEALNARLGYDAFVPSVQKASLPNPALTKTPAEIMKAKEQNNVPLMMGATRHDGSFVAITTFYDYLVKQGLDSNAEFIKNDLLPTFLKGVGIEDPSGALVHSLVSNYLGDAANADDITSMIPGLVDIHSVLGFKAGAYGLVEAHADLNPSSYYFAFDYAGRLTTYDIANGENAIPGGVAHVDDLLYLFQLLPLYTDEEWGVSNRYVEYWANFAAYGNPNGEGNKDEPFPKYNAADHRFLVINVTDSMGIHCRDTWVGNSYELV